MDNVQKLISDAVNSLQGISAFESHETQVRVREALQALLQAQAAEAAHYNALADEDQGDHLDRKYSQG